MNAIRKVLLAKCTRFCSLIKFFRDSTGFARTGVFIHGSDPEDRSIQSPVRGNCTYCAYDEKWDKEVSKCIQICNNEAGFAIKKRNGLFNIKVKIGGIQR